jgi:cell division protein ZapA
MAQVSITINGRGYQIACDDGQEEHLRRLASYVDRRVAELVAAMGQIGDQRLLVMASLLVADELSDVTAELEDAKRQIQATENAESGSEAAANAVMERLTQRLTDIAARLERP